MKSLPRQARHKQEMLLDDLCCSINIAECLGCKSGLWNRAIWITAADNISPLIANGSLMGTECIVGQQINTMVVSGNQFKDQFKNMYYLYNQHKLLLLKSRILSIFRD